MVVLDPSAKKPSLDFFTTNYEQLKVRLYKVEPGDLDAFAKYLREQWNHDHPPAMPGTKVLDQLMKTKTGWNELVETSVDLQNASTARRPAMLGQRTRRRTRRARGVTATPAEPARPPAPPPDDAPHAPRPRPPPAGRPPTTAQPRIRHFKQPSPPHRLPTPS